MDARAARTANTTVTDVRVLGPFYEHVETSAGDVRTSFRPFLYTAISVPQDDAQVHEVVWPIYADHSRDGHFAWRFLLVFGADFDTRDPQSRRFVWALPLWFHGRSKDGNTYAALFPVGGSIRDFLTFDLIRFAAFPLWMQTERNGVHGQHLLWPIFARAEGNGIHRWRVFPLCGYGRKDGEWERHFILWPFWSYARYDRQPTAGYEWALVPIVGRAERGVESSWYVVPPFFQFTFGKGPNEGRRRILAPWPLVRIEDSKDTHKRHFWPFYATTWSDRSRNTHVLWPFFQRTHSSQGTETRTAWSLAPFFHRAVERETPPEGVPETTRSYVRFWPFYSRLEQDGRSFVRVPDFSLHRRTGALERNFLHMFTLYTRGEQAAPGRVQHDLLWGLVRWGHGNDGNPDGKDAP